MSPCRNRAASVGAERQGANEACVAFENTQAFTGSRIPKPRRVVPRTGKDALSVAAPGQAPDAFGVSNHLVDARSRLDVPYADRPADHTGDRQSLIGTEGAREIVWSLHW